MMWGRVAAGTAIAAAGAGAVLAIDNAGGGRTAHGADRPTYHTAIVRRRNLVDRQRVDGTLGYSGQRQVANALGGTYTWLPPVGRVIHPGETLWAIDATPVVLMDGTVPAYRPLRRGEKGDDVLQLERGLSAAGYDPGTIDGTFDASTAAAVRAWQDARDLDATGMIELGRIVFLPGARRVTNVAAQVGGRAAPGPALTTTSTHRVVTIDLDAADQASAKVGARAPVELPDGTTVPGRVASVGRVATAASDQSGDGGGDPTITVTVHLTSTRHLGHLDAAPVSVRLARSRRHHVLAVPVTALVATPGGGYAVEIVRGALAPRPVAVSPGLFASGYVEVTPLRRGSLHTGDRVTVPS
jgi:peptidoglycan hydrolase-like protein with peptidoglycan-binding domain